MQALASRVAVPTAFAAKPVAGGRSRRAVAVRAAASTATKLNTQRSEEVRARGRGAWAALRLGIGAWVLLGGCMRRGWGASRRRMLAGRSAAAAAACGLPPPTRKLTRPLPLRLAQIFKEAQDLLPGGVNSPVRAFKSVGGQPIVFDRVKGAYCWDADNNKYIDYGALSCTCSFMLPVPWRCTLAAGARAANGTHMPRIKQFHVCACVMLAMHGACAPASLGVACRACRRVGGASKPARAPPPLQSAPGAPPLWATATTR